MKGKTSMGAGGRGCLLGLILALGSTHLPAQHGHPLVGTWSGERMTGAGSSRLLMVLDFSEDQTISGFVIENGKRLPFTNAELDPADWTVTLQGQRDGQELEIQGRIENLGSVTDRTIAGTWSEGGQESDFRVVMN